MCDCGKELNKALAEKNGRLAMALQVTEKMGLRSRLCIATEKIDKTKRKPLPTVVANYCPFCGEKMADDSETPNDQASGGAGTALPLQAPVGRDGDE